MTLPEWHALIQWQKNLMDALNENVFLSPCIPFLQALFARFDSAPSTTTHFQFIKEKIVTNTRGSVGKAIVKCNRNTKVPRKQEENKQLEQTINTLNARQHFSPASNFTFYQYLNWSIFKQTQN